MEWVGEILIHFTEEDDLSWTLNKRIKITIEEIK